MKNCPSIEEFSFKDCPTLRYITDPFAPSPSLQGECESLLTSVSVCGCKLVDNKFIQALTEMTGVNLKKLDISCTSADCFALLYLAGYTLEKVFQLKEPLDGTINDGEDTNGSYHLTPAASALRNDLLNTNLLENAPVMEVCNICFSACVGRVIPEVPVQEEQFEIIFSKFPCQSNSNHDDWEVYSMVDESDINLCQCPAITETSLLHNVEEERIKLRTVTKEKLFSPNLVYLDIIGMDFPDDELGKQCLELFLASNTNLEHFFISWRKLDSELNCLVQNDIQLKTLHLVGCFSFGDCIKNKFAFTQIVIQNR